jgi:hypothetical protein
MSEKSTNALRMRFVTSMTMVQSASKPIQTVSSIKSPSKLFPSVACFGGTLVHAVSAFQLLCLKCKAGGSICALRPGRTFPCEPPELSVSLEQRA